MTKNIQKGLKLNNEHSTVPLPKVSSTKDLEEKATEISDKNEDYKRKLMELSTQFKTMMEDQTLLENKGPLVLNIEKELMMKLYALTKEINNDDYQPESEGSNSFCLLLMRMMVLQRNKINELSYKVSKLEQNKEK